MSGVRGPLAADISCVALGAGSQVDLGVNGPNGAGGDVALVRDVLRDRMLGGRSTGNLGGPAPDSITPEQFAQLYADLSMAVAAVGRAQLGWVDEQDPSGPSNDPGRGIADGQAHYGYALTPQGRATVPALIRERMRVIQENASAEQYANLYAAVSVRIATLGRVGLGWVDGLDPRAGPDQGRGISNRDTHYGYPLSNAGNARGSVALIGDRLSSMLGGRSTGNLGGPAPDSITPEQFAQLYADLSMAVAAVGRAQLGWVDGQDPSGPSNDSGRGISDGQAHYGYALASQGRATVPALIQERMRVIQENVSAEQYANLYAAVSVRIATLGRAGLGWVDGPDPRAGPDQGRGISNRDTHYGYPLSNTGNARGSVALIGERLSTAVSQLGP